MYFAVPPGNLFIASILQVLPTLSLAYYVIMASQKSGYLPRSWPRDEYASNFTYALVATAGGDACFVNPDLFVVSTLSYSLGIVLYIRGMQAGGVTKNTNLKMAYVVVGIGFYFLLFLGMGDYLTKVVILLYLSVLFWAGYLATARYVARKTIATAAACVGFNLYIIGDLILMTMFWVVPFFPLGFNIAMFLYYGGQLGRALSTPDGAILA
jgi:uncharacterized membrane protein YhhN